MLDSSTSAWSSTSSTLQRASIGGGMEASASRLAPPPPTRSAFPLLSTRRMSVGVQWTAGWLACLFVMLFPRSVHVECCLLCQVAECAELLYHRTLYLVLFRTRTLWNEARNVADGTQGIWVCLRAVQWNVNAGCSFMSEVEGRALQTALILSIPRRRPVDETQETLRTSAFPSTHIKEKWAKNLYIGGITYGRTVS